MFPANLQLHFQNLQQQQPQLTLAKPPRPRKEGQTTSKHIEQWNIDLHKDTTNEEELNLLPKIGDTKSGEISNQDFSYPEGDAVNHLSGVEEAKIPLTNVCIDTAAIATRITNDDKRQTQQHYSSVVQPTQVISSSTSTLANFDTRRPKNSNSNFTSRFNFSRLLTAIDDDTDAFGEFLAPESKAVTTSTNFTRFNSTRACCDSCRPLPPIALNSGSTPSSLISNNEPMTTRFLPATFFKRATINPIASNQSGHRVQLLSQTEIFSNH